MLNSYLVNAAVVDGTGTSQITVSAIAFTSSVPLYNSLCQAFRIGTTSSGNSTYLTRSVNPVAYIKQVGNAVGYIKALAMPITKVVSNTTYIIKSAAVGKNTTVGSAINIIRFIRLFESAVVAEALTIVRFLRIFIATVVAGNTVSVKRYVYRTFVATVSNVLKVALYIAYTAAAVASNATDYIKYIKSIFALTVFNAAGKNALDYNPVDGFVMNGFALNDGVSDYKEERVIIGIIVDAVTSVAASTVRYVSRFFNALSSSTLKVVKSCQVSFKATVAELQAVIRLARLIEVAVASEAVTYIKFLRVVIATLVAGSSVKAIKMVKLPSQVAAASTKYVSKKCGLIKNTAVYTLNELVRTIGKPIKATVSNTAAAFKLRVVERIVATIVKVSYIRFMWNYSSVSTIVKASRIRLAFLVGVRVLSQWIIGLFKSNTTYVCVNMSTIYVVDKYDPIVVPPEDTEIV
jgi:hypothetical protein